jgi:hypothetical protein
MVLVVLRPVQAGTINSFCVRNPAQVAKRRSQVLRKERRIRSGPRRNQAWGGVLDLKQVLASLDNEEIVPWGEMMSTVERLVRRKCAGQCQQESKGQSEGNGSVRLVYS